MKLSDIRRVDYGYFVRPADETPTGEPRVEPCLGYLVRYPGGVFVFDTGMGAGDTELDDHYRIRRRPLTEALRGASVSTDEVTVVVNCHLHFDHCGGNPDLQNRPVFVQGRELATARALDDYTLPHLVDFAGANYTELEGEAEIFPNILVIPTPGHTEGHQSVAVRCDDGTVVLAGQAHDHATDFTASQLAARATAEGATGPIPAHHAWVERLLALDPRRVVFAHDNAVWEPA